jgi:hypothetical protein
MIQDNKKKERKRLLMDPDSFVHASGNSTATGTCASILAQEK